MEARELRIGNYFYFKGDSIGRFGKLQRWKSYYFHLMHSEDWILPKIIEPIPLIEQWFLDLGFEKIEGIAVEGYKIKTTKGANEFMIFKIDHLWHFGFNEKQCFCYSHFRYVHQLQNLFIDLTQEVDTIRDE